MSVMKKYIFPWNSLMALITLDLLRYVSVTSRKNWKINFLKRSPILELMWCEE